MDARQVIDKILADANQQAEEIKKQADEEQAGEQAAFDEQLKQYQQQTEVIAQKAGEDKASRMLAAARMEAAKEYLAEKGKIIDQIFQQAGKQLKAMADDEYCKLMEKLLVKAIETGDEAVIVDSNEKRINQKFIKDINRKLGPGYQGNLRLSEKQRDIGSGFILERGKIQSNFSLPVLLAQARDVLEIELAKELFADDNA